MTPYDGVDGRVVICELPGSYSTNQNAAGADTGYKIQHQTCRNKWIRINQDAKLERQWNQDTYRPEESLCCLVSLPDFYDFLVFEIWEVQRGWQSVC